MTNNYLKILLYLKQFEGDGKFHEIENVLGDIDKQEKREIITELAREDLIYLEGGHMTGLPLIGFGDGRGNVKWIGGDTANSKYVPFSGKLKFKGSKYLKEELEMIDKDKYNIKVGDGSTANVIISSPGATINNKTDIIDKVRAIIKVIETDNTIDTLTQQTAIGDFKQLLKEVEQDRKNPATIEKIVSFGGNLSSIGSLVVSLIQLLARH